MYRTYLTTIKNSLSVGLCVAQIDCHLPHIHIVFPVDQGLMMKTNCGMVSMMFVSSFVQKILLLKSPWPVPLVSMLFKKNCIIFWRTSHIIGYAWLFPPLKFKRMDDMFTTRSLFLCFQVFIDLLFGDSFIVTTWYDTRALTKSESFKHWKRNGELKVKVFRSGAVRR